MKHHKQPGWARLAIASALVAGTMGIGAGQDARAEVPCAWLRYNLPAVGSSGLSSCARAKGPGMGQGSLAPHHRQRVGSYYVEVRADLPIPD